MASRDPSPPRAVVCFWLLVGAVVMTGTGMGLLIGGGISTEYCHDRVDAAVLAVEPLPYYGLCSLRLEYIAGDAVYSASTERPCASATSLTSLGSVRGCVSRLHPDRFRDQEESGRIVAWSTVIGMLVAGGAMVAAGLPLGIAMICALDKHRVHTEQ